MKVIKEGREHKAIAWFRTCPNCSSEFRIIVGDPHASREYYNCDRNQYWIRYKCPVCGTLDTAMTRSCFGTPEANAQRKHIFLTDEDRKEIESFSEEVELTEEEKRHFGNYCCP